MMCEIYLTICLWEKIIFKRIIQHNSMVLYSGLIVTLILNVEL